MPTSTPQSLVEQLRWRYATKQFDAARTIPAETWQALEDALVLSPSSFGLQPWRFYVVRDAALRERLKPASWNQPQITEASHLVVLAAKKDVGVADVDALLARTVALRGGSLEALAGYRQMMAGFVTRPGFDTTGWASRQVYLALGQFLTAAAVLGIDACPMEGFDPAQYDEILGIGAEGFTSVVVAAAGYRAASDKYATLAKVRFPGEQVIRTIG